MKKFIALIATAVVVALFCSPADAKKKSGTDADKDYRYDIEYVKSAGTGMSTVRVWSYNNDKKDNEDVNRRDAVHAVIFKGYSGNGATQPPLARDVNTEANNADFFNTFFSNSGEYRRFTTSVGEYETVKTGKFYKHGATVAVNVKALRKYLEEHGIIKALNAGF